MNKNTKIKLISLFIIIIILIFFIYKVVANSQNVEDINGKTMSEIQYLESKYEELFNKLNNINTENYEISSSKIEENEKSSSESSSSSGGQSESGGESKQSGGTGEESSKSSKQGETSTSESKSSESDNKQYNLEQKGILTKDSNIDWNDIKNDIETLNSYIPIITLDLYKTSTNQQDIVDFSNEYNNLIKIVKNEDKNATLAQLSKLYEYIPKFAENSTSSQSKIVSLKTKNNVFKAYSILEQENWNDISKNVNEAIKEFTRLVTDINSDNQNNQYDINKVYVILNEMQNAVDIQDKEVFLVKYKNLLEVINNLN